MLAEAMDLVMQIGWRNDRWVGLEIWEVAGLRAVR